MEDSRTEELMGPDILESEVENALCAMKNGKSPRHDEIIRRSTQTHRCQNNHRFIQQDIKNWPNTKRLDEVNI